MGSRTDRGVNSTHERESLRVACAALGETNRLRLLRWLFLGPRTVGSLVEATSLPQPLVSHHLAVMSQAGLIEARRDGRNREYSVCSSPPMIQELLDLTRRIANLEPQAVTPGVPAASPSAGTDELPEPTPPHRSGIEDYLL